MEVAQDQRDNEARKCTEFVLLMNMIDPQKLSRITRKVVLLRGDLEASLAER